MCGVLFYLPFLIVACAAQSNAQLRRYDREEEEVKDEDLQTAETHLSSYGFGLGGGGGGSSFGIGSAGGYFPQYHRGYVGGELDKNFYGKGHKNLNDGKYEGHSGQQGGEVSQGRNGFSQGKNGLRASKGGAAHFGEQSGAKKASADGIFQKGGRYFSDQGRNADENEKKSNSKKGHVIKGFKSSHRKDENEKTEEYYDEAKDEGDSLNVSEQGKKYGENSGAEFRGGHSDEEFATGNSKKQGEYDSSRFFHEDGGEGGEYGGKKYSGSRQLHGSKSGNDLESLRGHHESGRVYKHHPHYYYR